MKKKIGSVTGAHMTSELARQRCQSGERNYCGRIEEVNVVVVGESKGHCR